MASSSVEGAALGETRANAGSAPPLWCMNFELLPTPQSRATLLEPEWNDYEMPLGRADLDSLNPDPSLRQRHLCGLMIIWGLQPGAPGHRTGGLLYEPKDGATRTCSPSQSIAA
jgi:hypothetical protein